MFDENNDYRPNIKILPSDSRQKKQFVEGHIFVGSDFLTNFIMERYFNSA